MPASNTKDCFREFIGQKVVGCLFDAMPMQNKGLAAGSKTLVFDDGRGLTIGSNGSYWVESSEEIERAIRRARRELAAVQHELAGVLALEWARDA